MVAATSAEKTSDLNNQKNNLNKTKKDLKKLQKQHHTKIKWANRGIALGRATSLAGAVLLVTPFAPIGAGLLIGGLSLVLTNNAAKAAINTTKNQNGDSINTLKENVYHETMKTNSLETTNYSIPLTGKSTSNNAKWEIYHSLDSTNKDGGISEQEGFLKACLDAPPPKSNEEKKALKKAITKKLPLQQRLLPFFRPLSNKGIMFILKDPIISNAMKNKDFTDLAVKKQKGFRYNLFKSIPRLQNTTTPAKNFQRKASELEPPINISFEQAKKILQLMEALDRATDTAGST